MSKDTTVCKCNHLPAQHIMDLGMCKSPKCPCGRFRAEEKKAVKAKV